MSPYSNATAQLQESKSDLKETNEEQTPKFSIEILNGIPIKNGNKKQMGGNALILHNYKVSSPSDKMISIVGFLWLFDFPL